MKTLDYNIVQALVRSMGTCPGCGDGGCFGDVHCPCEGCGCPADAGTPLAVWNVTDYPESFYDIGYCSTEAYANELVRDMEHGFPMCKYVILPEGVEPDEHSMERFMS